MSLRNFMKKITKYNKLQKKKTLALSILYPIYVTVFFIQPILFTWTFHINQTQETRGKQWRE